MGPMSEAFKEQVARIWLQFRDVVVGRLSPIEAAVCGLASGSFTAADLKAAEDAAHKLAGSLGTFGMPDGSLVARDLEVLLQEASPDLSRVEALTRELEAILTRGPQ